MFLKISQIHRKTPVLKSLSNKLQTPRRQLCWKKNPTLVFPFEFRKNVKNTVFKKTGQLFLEDFVFNSLVLVGYLIRQTFIHSRYIISDPGYKKRLDTKYHFLGSVKLIYSVALFPDIG